MLKPFASITEAGDALRRGDVSSASLTESILERIRTLNPRFNAFITVTDELARERARAADAAIRAGESRGPLLGVPVAVKDFYDTAGIRTTAAFARFRDRVPAEDAEVVRRLHRAGAVLVGKTNMHRLGTGTTSLESDFGPVVNPRSARHVPGGSSGGSAAAVATGMCFATVDTDAVGSGRLPAAICGVTCFKPTFGVLSTRGVLAGEPVEPPILALSHGCVTARSPDDVMLAFGVLANRTVARDTLPRRIGVVANFNGTPAIRSAFDNLFDTLGVFGTAIDTVEVPFSAATFDVRNIDRDRAAINDSLFKNVDLLVLPTLAASAPTVDEARAAGELAVAPANTFFANYFALPAISVPVFGDAGALPFAVQFVGPRDADDVVLNAATTFARATGWEFVPPKV